MKSKTSPIIKPETKKLLILDNDSSLKQSILEGVFRTYNNLRVLDCPEGSTNPFLIAAINSLLLEEGLRIARLSEIKDILPGPYFDLGFILRETDRQGETYIGKDLLSQIGHGTQHMNLPMKIDLADLVIVRDSNSDNPFGCSFQLRDNPVIAYSLSILNNRNGNFSDRDVNSKIGLPEKCNPQGRRKLFTQCDELYQQDITRLIFTKYRDINTNYPNLSRPLPGGKIPVVKND